MHHFLRVPGRYSIPEEQREEKQQMNISTPQSNKYFPGEKDFGRFQEYGSKKTKKLLEYLIGLNR